MSRRLLLVILLVLAAATGGALADVDGDGLDTVSELQAGSDVFQPDTDDDGLTDGEEQARGTAPLASDTDADGVADGLEVERGTDPLRADTDGDGLDDGEEATLGTDPLSVDTDGDGLDDGRERALGTDPLVLDTDGDGLTDGEEVSRSTDPLDRDSDDDRLEDGREVDLGTDPLATDTDGDGIADAAEVTGDTDPTLADTDGDGLDDGREIELDTEPLLADTDSDGLRDGREVELGADPLEPDTDGDRLLDGAEVHRRDVLPGASPTRMDLFVEVDAVEGVGLPVAEAERVVDAFLEAPVGPNASRGITLHVVYNESGLADRGAVKVADRPNLAGGEDVRLRTYMADHYDFEGYGYHYLLVVPEVLDVPDSEVVGEAERGAMAVQASSRDDVTGSTFMHELGHTLGLSRADFDGIDSRRYTVEEYPSVMNYEAPPDYYGFSSDEPFDDWGAIETSYYVPDTSGLDSDE